jgi:hypothetical protein
MLRLLIATVGLIDVLNGSPMMKPRKEFWPDSVAPLPSIVTFFVTAGRFEPSVIVILDVKVIVSPFAALLMALARSEALLTLMFAQTPEPPATKRRRRAGQSAPDGGSKTKGPSGDPRRSQRPSATRHRGAKRSCPPFLPPVYRAVLVRRRAKPASTEPGHGLTLKV